MQHLLAIGEDATEVLRDVEAYEKALEAEQAKELEMKEGKEEKDAPANDVVQAEQVGF